MRNIQEGGEYLFNEKHTLQIRLNSVQLKCFNTFDNNDAIPCITATPPLNLAILAKNLTLTPRRLRPIRIANKTQTRDPLNLGPCKADWPAAFVIK